MPVREPYPERGEILVSIGEAGARIAAIGASEVCAGNISVCIGWPIEVRRQFPVATEIRLPLPAPHLRRQDGSRLKTAPNDTLRSARLAPSGY